MERAQESPRCKHRFGPLKGIWCRSITVWTNAIGIELECPPSLTRNDRFTTFAFTGLLVHSNVEESGDAHQQLGGGSLKCPVCDVELRIAERQGVEIDYCPQCRGIWLDRGELDKIIERTETALSASNPGERREPFYRKRDDHDDDYGYPYKKKKRRSFFSDFFDFD